MCELFLRSGLEAGNQLVPVVGRAALHGGGAAVEERLTPGGESGGDDAKLPGECVEVLTPEGEVFNDEVVQISTKTTIGSIGILANHQPMLAMLDPTELRLYKSESDVVRLAQGEGYLQVQADSRVLILVDEAGGRCAACGYDRCFAALQFHHVDPGAKAFALSHQGATRGIERARVEARKCVLLCANCHAEVEAGVRVLQAPRGGFEPPRTD